MSLKILVVDDEGPTLEVISEILRSLSLDVLPVGDSQQAALLINEEKFDGIFLDLMMPALDGFELARRIRDSSRNRTTPIVILTGLQERKTMEKAFDAGGTFFLAKPIDRGKLTRLLGSIYGIVIEERDRLQRIPVSMEVECEYRDRKITGTSSNLSLTGILVQGDGSLAPGNRVRLSFRLPGEETAIKTDGIVIRVGRNECVGVRFALIDGQDRKRIREFIFRKEAGP